MPAPPPAKTLTPRSPGIQRGFTLIEIIVVIVLLGILAAVVVPRFAGIGDQALRVSAQSAASEAYTRLKGASQLYVLDNVTPVQQLTDLAPARYLNLGAGNSVTIGGFLVVYNHTLGDTEAIIQVFATDGTTLVHTLTVNWP